MYFPAGMKTYIDLYKNRLYVSGYLITGCLSTACFCTDKINKIRNFISVKKNVFSLTESPFKFFFFVLWISVKIQKIFQKFPTTNTLYRKLNNSFDAVCRPFSRSTRCGFN